MVDIENNQVFLSLLTDLKDEVQESVPVPDEQQGSWIISVPFFLFFLYLRFVTTLIFFFWTFGGFSF